MKKRGAQRIMEMVTMVAATRGMVCREKTKRFMRIPPNSIPKAAAGRFTAPAGETELICVLGLGARSWTSRKGAWLQDEPLARLNYNSNC